MFYFMRTPILMCNWVLILAAIIPAVFLMIKVYQSDRLEHESWHLLIGLMAAGIIATLIALIEEKFGSAILAYFVSQDSGMYDILLYFVVVAIAEESSKYLLMKLKTWHNPEFNCQYDGVVYAVFVALGFALWENISYVLNYGFGTALVRAVTAIPGHACFGVFMGVFYGVAKRYDYAGNEGASKFFRCLSLIAPVLLHGSYDYIAASEQVQSGWAFVVFIAAMFVLAFMLINRAAKQDRYIDRTL